MQSSGFTHMFVEPKVEVEPLQTEETQVNVEEALQWLKRQRERDHLMWQDEGC